MISITEIEARIKELEDEIASFRAKLFQADDLSSARQKGQLAANVAQNTANSALSEVSFLQSGIQDGSIIAEKAVMLRAKDDIH